MTNLMLNCLFLTFSNVRLFQLYGTDYMFLRSTVHLAISIASQPDIVSPIKLQRYRTYQRSKFTLLKHVDIYQNTVHLHAQALRTFACIATLWDLLYYSLSPNKRTFEKRQKRAIEHQCGHLNVTVFSIRLSFIKFFYMF